MHKTTNNLQQHKAAIFDWLVLMLSISLGFIFPTLRDFVTSPFFSSMMLAALVLYLAGTWLKHFPLYYRLIRSGTFNKGVPLSFFLVIGHWCIMYVVSTLAWPAFRKITGMTAVKAGDSVDGWEAFTTIVAASFITWLVYRPKTKIKTRKLYSPGYMFRRELIGDVLLLLAVGLFSFAFWEKGILAMLSGKSIVVLADIWFLFIFLAISYMLCYLPLRYLFLVEDYNRKGTWRRMLLIFAFLLLKALFDMLNS